MSSSETASISASDSDNRRKFETGEQYLLAFAKDVRNVQHCTDLLGHILGPSSARSSRILVEYISWILYILLTTKTINLPKEGGRSSQRTTTTPGMKVCQVVYVWKNGASEKASLWSRFSSALLWNSSSSLTKAALFSVTLFYGIRWQSDRIQRIMNDGSNANHNQYQGQARRNFYLLQRQEMIRRGRDLENGTAGTPSGSPTVGTDPRLVSQTILAKTSGQSPIWNRILPRLRVVLHAIMVALDRALSSKTTEGPHEPFAAATNVPEVASSSTLEARLRQIFVWIFQFHLAWYCISGNHPTMFHRFFFKHRVVMKKPDGPDPSLPTTSVMPVVGAMLLCRLSYQILFHAVSQPLIRFCATQRHASSLRARSIKSKRTPTTTHVPAQNSVTVVGRSPSTERASHMACYICQQEPLYPSCLTPCGHVFCWYCIHQWITDHDAKCPICRVHCTSKDVMHLYNV